MLAKIAEAWRWGVREGRWAVVGLCFGTALLLSGLANLNLEDYFLRSDPDVTSPRQEEDQGNATSRFQYFRFRPAKPMSWGELSESPGLGLDEGLVVESYRCSKKDTRSVGFADIKDNFITSNDSLIIVLRRGSCPEN